MDGNGKKMKFQRALTAPVKSSAVAFEKPAPLKKSNQYFWIHEDNDGKWHTFSNTNTDLIEVAFLAGHSAVYIHIEEENYRVDFSSLLMIQAPLSERKRKIEHEITEEHSNDITWNITSRAWSQIPWTAFGSSNDNNETKQSPFESVHQRMQTSPYEVIRSKRIRRLHRNPDAHPVPPLPEKPNKFPNLKKFEPVLNTGLESSLYHLEFGAKVVEWKLVKSNDEFLPFDYQTSCMIENAIETGKALIHLKHNHFANFQATVDLQKLTVTFTPNNNNSSHNFPDSQHVLSFVSKQPSDKSFKIQRFQSNLPFDWIYGQADNCQLYDVPQTSVEFARIEKVMLDGWKAWNIQSIRRIQNVYLWNRYCNERDHVAKTNGGNPNEKFLFHGTGRIQPNKVYNGQSGFDFRYASETNYYGTGTYFSAMPKYSHGYSSREDGLNDEDEDENTVLQFMVARVVCGDVFDYGEEMARTNKMPPVKPVDVPTFETGILALQSISNVSHIIQIQRMKLKCESSINGLNIQNRNAVDQGEGCSIGTTRENSPCSESLCGFDGIFPAGCVLPCGDLIILSAMLRVEQIANSFSCIFKEVWSFFETPNSIQKSSSTTSDIKLHNVSCVERIASLSRWSHLIACDDMLVTSSGSRKEIAFWQKPAGPSSWTQSYKTCVGEGVSQMKSWNLSGQTVVVSGTWEGSIFVLGSDGKILTHETKAHTDCVIAICMWNNMLVTADLNGIIKLWKMDVSNFSLTLTRSLEHSTKVYALQAVENDSHSSLWVAGYCVSMWNKEYHKKDLIPNRRRNLVTSLCKWKRWVVTGCMDGTVSLWDYNGRLEKHFEFSDYVGNLLEWKEHLCVGLLTKILVLDENGNCVAQMEGQGSHNMAVCQGMLITSSDTEILVYERKCSWAVARQLWVGCLKELPENCGLAVLPPEMIHHILEFV